MWVPPNAGPGTLPPDLGLGDPADPPPPPGGGAETAAWLSFRRWLPTSVRSQHFYTPIFFNFLFFNSADSCIPPPPPDRIWSLYARMRTQRHIMVPEAPALTSIGKQHSVRFTVYKRVVGSPRVRGLGGGRDKELSEVSKGALGLNLKCMFCIRDFQQTLILLFLLCGFTHFSNFLLVFFLHSNFKKLQFVAFSFGFDKFIFFAGLPGIV